MKKKDSTTKTVESAAKPTAAKRTGRLGRPIKGTFIPGRMKSLIMVRMGDKMKNILEAVAEKNGMTKSGYVRALIRHDIIRQVAR